MLFQLVGEEDEFSGYLAVSYLDCHSAALGSQVVHFYKDFQIIRHARDQPSPTFHKRWCRSDLDIGQERTVLGLFRPED
jgi:hypothetical protein